MANTVYTLESTGVRGKFDELQDRLWSVQQPTEAVHWIQVYLTKYFDQKARVGVGDFSPVMHHMLRFPAALTVGDLARKFKCSERWIEKQCAIQTGLPPKSWLRLIRYRAAANYWLRHPEVPWMGIVAKFNYTDQSHLIRDFRAFAGNPPVAHFVQYGRTETMLKQDEAGLSGLLHKAN